MKPRKVTTKNYQISGMEHGRIMRGYMRTRIIRFGNFGDGVGAGNMLKLAVLHYFGHAIAWASLRFEPHYIRLRQRLARIRSRA